MSGIAPDLLERFAAIVGPRQALREAADVAPYVTERRGLFPGRAALVLRPGSVEEVSRILALATASAHAGGPAGRQHRAGRRPGAGPQRPRHRAVAVAARPHPRDRPALQHRDRGGRDRPADLAGGRRGRRPPLPAVACVGGFGADRRQPLRQCRRHGRARLWQRPRALPRAGGGAADRRGPRRPPQAQEGQHRLRPEGPVHRRRRHARRHHGGRAEALPAAPGAGGRLGRGAVAARRAGASVVGARPCRRRADRLRAGLRPAASTSCSPIPPARARRSPPRRPGTC